MQIPEILKEMGWEIKETVKDFASEIPDNLHSLRVNFRWLMDYTDRIREKDIDKSGKICSALAYFFFFIPLVVVPENQFARFHANQGLINLVLSLLVGALLAIIPYAGFWLFLGVELFCLFNQVRGVITSLRGKAKGIPAFGQIAILAYGLPGGGQ